MGPGAAAGARSPWAQHPYVSLASRSVPVSPCRGCDNRRWKTRLFSSVRHAGDTVKNALGGKGGDHAGPPSGLGCVRGRGRIRRDRARGDPSGHNTKSKEGQSWEGVRRPAGPGGLPHRKGVAEIQAEEGSRGPEAGGGVNSRVSAEVSRRHLWAGGGDAAPKEAPTEGDAIFKRIKFHSCSHAFRP